MPEEDTVQNPLKLFSTIILWCVASLAVAQELPISFENQPGNVRILAGEQPLAAYNYSDRKIPRPYFAHVRTLDGIQVTRNHPPIAGRDLVDHDTFHPGIWLAFGDLQTADNWRLKAPVRHIEFLQQPKGQQGQGSFAVHNQYLASDGQRVVCDENCQFTVKLVPDGYLLLWDSTFRSNSMDFAFGDQEEMGLGFRVATPLSVKNGGSILLSSGEKDEKAVRGKSANWCDYSGRIDSRYVGISVMPHSDNFRASWYHARDYGFVAANPFGRKALTGGEPSSVTVRKGEAFRLRFGVYIHSSDTPPAQTVAETYKLFTNMAF